MWKNEKKQNKKQKWLKPKSHHIKTEGTGSNVHTFNTLCGVQYWESCNHPTFSCQFVCFRKWNWNDSMLNGSENSFMSIYLRLFLCNPLCGWCISWWHTNQTKTPTRTVWNGMERNGAPAESRSSMHGKVETYTHIDNSGGRNVRTRTHQVGKTTKLHRSEQMNDGTKQWNWTQSRRFRK